MTGAARAVGFIRAGLRCFVPRSGKPVLAHNKAFARTHPADECQLACSTLDQAVEAIERDGNRQSWSASLRNQE